MKLNFANFSCVTTVIRDRVAQFNLSSDWLIWPNEFLSSFKVEYSFVCTSLLQ